MRIRHWLSLIVLTAALVLVTAPRQTGLSMVTPFAQVIAFRGVWAVLVGVLWVVALGGFLASRTSARRGRSGAHPLLVLIVVTVAALGQLGTVWSRGVDPDARANPEMIAQQTTSATDDFTVVSINTEWNAVDPQWIANLALSSKAKMIALPESEKSHADQVATALEEAGQPGWQVFATTNPWPNAMLVSPEAGPYRLRPNDNQGLVIADPVNEQVNGFPAPVLVTVHAAPPPSMMPWTRGHSRASQEWKQTLTEASQLIRSEPVVIAAGDFNATVDHAALDPGVRDATVGTSAWGTWPNWLPSWASARIDHVFAKPYDATRGSWVVDAPGSDHRAVVVRLTTFR